MISRGGANGGLGSATAEHLASRGARVILCCRRPDQGEAVARRIGVAAEVLPLDLADLTSIGKTAAMVGAASIASVSASSWSPAARTSSSGGPVRQVRAGDCVATGSTIDAVAGQPGWCDTEAGMHAGKPWGDLSWKPTTLALGSDSATHIRRAGELLSAAVSDISVTHLAGQGHHFDPRALATVLADAARR